jgi:hypothetical protein
VVLIFNYQGRKTKLTDCETLSIAEVQRRRRGST